MAHRPQTILYAILAVALSAIPAEAGFQVDVTTAENWTDGLDRIAIVTEECAESLNCRDVEERLARELRAVWRKHTTVEPGDRGIWIVRPDKITKALMRAGLTEYDPDKQEELIRELEVDALMVIKVPSGMKGAYGWKGSESKMDLHITNGKQLLLIGTGSGRARNTLTSPERVAANIGEKILEEALKQ